MALTLHLVRHGQSVWNLEGRVQGQAPDAPGLTDPGRTQAAAAASVLAAAGPIDRVLTSDLVRARETASPIGAALGLVPVVDVRLREQAMGSLQGMLSNEAFEWWRDESWTPELRLGGEAGESSLEVTARVGGLLSELVGDPALRSVVLVSHGGAIRVLLGLLVATAPERHFDWDPDVTANGSITTCRVADGVLVELTTLV